MLQDFSTKDWLHLYQVEQNHDVDKPHPLLPEEPFEGTANAAYYRTTYGDGGLGVHGGVGGCMRRFLELDSWSWEGDGGEGWEGEDRI